MWRTDAERAIVMETIALEASIAFSWLTWMQTLPLVWPSADPVRTALALFAGATQATLLCHIVPAWWAGRQRPAVAAPAMAAGVWFVRAAMAAGAVLLIAEMANGSTVFAYFVGRAAEWARTLLDTLGRAGIATAAVLGAVSGWMPPRWRFRAAGASAALGLGLQLWALLAYRPGVATLSRFASEKEMDNSWEVTGPMTCAAVPAVWVAVRLGRHGVSRRSAIGSGLIGLWIPLMASVAFGSVARMWGARLYWRPSLPVGYEYAIPDLADPRLQAIGWTLAFFTVAGTCMACSLCLKDMTEGVASRGRAALIAAAVVAIALWRTTWGRSWLWSEWYSFWCLVCVMGFGIASRRLPPRDR